MWCVMHDHMFADAGKSTVLDKQVMHRNKDCGSTFCWGQVANQLLCLAAYSIGK
jgi:hypothetical protein